MEGHDARSQGGQSLRRRAVAILVAACLASLSCGPPPPDPHEVARHINYLERSLAEVRREGYRRQWELFTGGAATAEERVPGANLAFFDHQNFAAWRGRLEDPYLARKVVLLHAHTLAAAVESDAVTMRLSRSLALADRERPRILDGAAATDAELEAVIRLDPDRGRRARAWAVRYTAPGAAAAADLTALIRRRSHQARELDYPSYYELGLEVSGIERVRVEQLIDDLEVATREPARAAVARLATAIGRRPAPWDVEVEWRPLLREIEPYLGADVLLTRALRTVADLGLPVEGLCLTIDADVRPGRSQHFFAFPLEVPDDLRILVTPAAGFNAYRATIHELGHVLYYAHSGGASLVERLPPNGAFSEGVGKVFERLPYQADWLVTYAGVPRELAARVGEYVAADELMRVRRFIAGHRFERAAYRTAADGGDAEHLHRLYRQVMEDVTLLDYGDADSEWAARVHYTTQPLANAEYLLARLIQAQVYRAIEARFGRVVGGPEVGDYLRRELIEPGGLEPWEVTVARATGGPLAITDYLRGELRLE